MEASRSQTGLIAKGSAGVSFHALTPAGRGGGGDGGGCISGLTLQVPSTADSPSAASAFICKSARASFTPPPRLLRALELPVPPSTSGAASTSSSVVAVAPPVPLPLAAMGASTSSSKPASACRRFNGTSLTVERSTSSAARGPSATFPSSSCSTPCSACSCSCDSSPPAFSSSYSSYSSYHDCCCQCFCRSAFRDKPPPCAVASTGAAMADGSMAPACTLPRLQVCCCCCCCTVQGAVYRGLWNRGFSAVPSITAADSTTPVQSGDQQGIPAAWLLPAGPCMLLHGSNTGRHYRMSV
ncbi:hypothetical protein Vafri_1107 [Volvox africanus]|nr:hypothetical protein Vafri_1107 [Volvox africanus]